MVKLGKGKKEPDKVSDTHTMRLVKQDEFTVVLFIALRCTIVKSFLLVVFHCHNTLICVIREFEL